MKGDEKILGVLQQQKEQLRGKDFFGRTALHYAACKPKEPKEGWTSTPPGGATLSLQSPGDKNDKDLYGMTALHIAAEAGHVLGVQKLTTVYANTTTKDSGHRTALHLAVLGCRSSVISELLERKGCDEKDILGRTAMHLVALSEDVEEILQKGENSKGWEEKWEVERSEVAGWVSKLVSKFHGERDIDGRTVLHLAFLKGRKALVGLLLDYKEMDETAKTDDGATMLHLAAKGGHEALVKQLLDRGMDVDATTSDGATALHLAAKGDRLAVVELLVDKVAGIDFQGGSYGSALQEASAAGHDLVV